MFKAFMFAFLPISVFLSGCSIHPLPEDVARVSTYDIVRQIRCETRKAVFDSAVQWLAKSSHVSEPSRIVGKSFANDSRPVNELKPELLAPRERKLLAYFWQTGVAYNYVLVMQEDNDLSTSVSLLKPFTSGKATYGFGAGINKFRKNTRTFTVTDTFGELVNKTPIDYCDSFIRDENFVYPITGRIGMEAFVKEFVYLTLFANLDGRTGEPATNPAGPPTLVDALEFQTKISGSANPKVEFTPVKGLQVANASLMGSATRTDLHKVTVGFAILPKGDELTSDIRSGYYFGPLLSAKTKSPATTAALNAVNQAITTDLLDRTIVVNQ